MANPTNPFSWQMPTASDLVTDLPADFEIFGQAVATSMADLLGGTSGQVLSKASNTDMDFTWVTSDDANAIQNSIVDAKGDLIGATANDTPARLAVGANGTMLVANSAESTGLKWTTATDQFPWQTWTPSYTALTVGNGTVVARYQQIGKLVNVFFRITWGSTTSCGAYPTVSYPVNPAYTVYWSGDCTLRDVGSKDYLGRTFIDGPGLLFTSELVSGTYNEFGTITATSPATWTTGDIWTMTARYEAA